MGLIYLDNAATTFQKPERVYTAMANAMRHHAANPGRGGHRLSLAAGDILYSCREALCELFHAQDPSRMVLCPNTTAALNIAIKGVLAGGGHAVISSMEHNSVLRPLEALAAAGTASYTIVRANANGILDDRAVERAIRPNTRLLLCTHASNVCGNIYDIGRLSEIAHRHGILFCVDAAQSAGILEIDARQVDLLAFPGHKGLMGPQGSGGLYIADGVNLATIQEGGTGSQSERYQQPDILPDRFESGTQNVPAAAGLTEGVRFVLREGVDAIHAHERDLTDRLAEQVQNIPGAEVYGGPERVGVLAMNLRGLDCVEVCNQLDSDFGIAVRGGLHCSILAHETLGTKERGCIRFSPGYFNRKSDMDRAAYALHKIAQQSQGAR